MRNSPWGELAVADAHVHFFSHHFFELLAGQKKASLDEVAQLTGFEIPPPAPEALAAHWAAELDRHGVQQAALIASLPGDEGSVATAVHAHPDRFFGYFMLNPLEADATARARYALDSGMRGVCLFPAMHRYSMHDEKALAIIDEAAKTPGAVVFVHCGVLSVGIRRKLGLASPFDMRYSNPIDLHAIALRYSCVNFVVPHFGAGYFREALMLCDLCPNVYLDTSSSNSWVKYLEHGANLRQACSQAIEVAGVGRLLFGTDSSFFPRGWVHSVFDEQARLLYELGIDRQQAEQIFGGNLRRLMGQV
jgi:hypothetical protein